MGQSSVGSRGTVKCNNRDAMFVITLFREIVSLAILLAGVTL